jgi:hypothetical protein
MTYIIDRDLDGPEFLRQLFQHDCNMQARIVSSQEEKIVRYADDLRTRHAHSRIPHDFIAVHGLGNYSMQPGRSHLSASGIAVMLEEERQPTAEENSIEPHYQKFPRLVRSVILTRVMHGFLRPAAPTLENELLEQAPLGLPHVRSQAWLVRNGTIYTNGWTANESFDKTNTRILGDVLPTFARSEIPGSTGLIFQYNLNGTGVQEAIVVPSYEHA